MFTNVRKIVRSVRTQSTPGGGENTNDRRRNDENFRSRVFSPSSGTTLDGPRRGEKKLFAARFSTDFDPSIRTRVNSVGTHERRSRARKRSRRSGSVRNKSASSVGHALAFRTRRSIRRDLFVPPASPSGYPRIACFPRNSNSDCRNNYVGRGHY